MHPPPWGCSLAAMTEKPWLYRRRDVARLFGVSHKTLRRWEQTGKLTPAPESTSNCVYYVREDIERLFSQWNEV